MMTQWLKKREKFNVIKAHVTGLSRDIWKGCFIIDVTNHNETVPYN